MDIAITTLATYVNERSSHSANIIDLAFHRRHWKQKIKEGISKYNPDIIAISSNTMYMKYVNTIIREVKEKYGLPIILGGHHASIYPEEAIKLPECDIVCRGDGEDALIKILNRLSSKKSMKGLAGVLAKENGGIIRNEGGYFRESLDDLPLLNWDLWEDLDKYFYYLGMLYMIGSRGCPYRCTYCDAHGISDAIGGKYFRLMNPEKYAKEIAYQWRRYKKRNLRLAQLFDPVFTMDEEWLEKFHQAYRKEGVHKEFRYSVFSRIDHLNENKIKLLADSGCALLRVGIEAGEERIRNDIYKKHVNNSKVKRIFKLAKDNGIGFTAFFIVGGPSESKATMQKTIDFAYELDGERSAFFVYKPFTKEGVELLSQHGGWIDQKRWEKADNITFGAVVHTGSATPREAEWFQKKAYFFTFGRRLIRMIKRQHIKYFIRLFVYMFRGLKEGLSFAYLITYYHIYGYDNIDK